MATRRLDDRSLVAVLQFHGLDVLEQTAIVETCQCDVSYVRDWSAVEER